MKTLSVFTMLISALLLFGCGGKASGDQSKTAGIMTVSISLPTIQCGTCKKNVETALKALDGVQKAEVDLKGKTVSVEFVAAKLDLSALETSITKAGYGANDKKADPDAYEQLDECCKLPADGN